MHVYWLNYLQTEGNNFNHHQNKIFGCILFKQYSGYSTFAFDMIIYHTGHLCNFTSNNVLLLVLSVTFEPFYLFLFFLLLTTGRAHIRSVIVTKLSQHGDIRDTAHVSRSFIVSINKLIKLVFWFRYRYFSTAVTLNHDCLCHQCIHHFQFLWHCFSKIQKRNI